MTAKTHRRTGRGTVKGTVTVVAALLAGLLAGTATWSAWVAQTDNSGNTFAAGSIVLADNDSGGAMFSLSGMHPGAAVNRCIRVDYTGTLPAAVRLFGAPTAGTGLGDYLQLTVTRGTDPTGTFSGCGTFVADVTDHSGLGAGVLFDDVMSAYPNSWASGIVDPQAAWTNGESHFYKFSAAVVNDDDAQSLTVTQTFSWQAQ